MLKEFLEPELERWQVSIENVYFQQEGATAHTARVVEAGSWFRVSKMSFLAVIFFYGDI